MRKKIFLKSMLTAAMAMSMFCSTVGATTAFAAGDEVVSFDISTDRICNEENNFLDKLLEQDLSEKIILVSTNDTHGALLDFTYVSQLRNLLKGKGAEVLIVDSGDFSTDKDVKGGYTQKSTLLGKPSNSTKGIAPVKIMNAVGYDVICLGNHEFEDDVTDLDAILNEIDFPIVDANISKSKYSDKIKPHLVLGENANIGFFGLDTLENNSWYEDYKFEHSENAASLHDKAKTEVEALKKADVIIGLTHLGVDDAPGGKVFKDTKKSEKYIAPTNPNQDTYDKYDNLYPEGIRSVDLFADVTGIDLLLDGHSHTTFTGCANFKEFNIQSNGIQFQNIGVVVIGKDNSGEYKIENRFLIPEKYYDEIGEDKQISGYIGYVLDTVKELTKNNKKIDAEKARKEIKDYDPDTDYSKYYIEINKDTYNTLGNANSSNSNRSSKRSGKNKRDFIDEAEDSASIEASLPESELEAADAASSASLENTDAANDASSEDEANIEASSEEISSDASSAEQSKDNSGNNGGHHRERHHNRNRKHGFGG
ncbi:bifunctional metallophosphatase/5'-nucleotidase [Butyrivibrio sp. X503]|uniref:metallophosphoesterase n=1 Tax=Butyrivibrio sp. X503 TaxID=2364878 RepID=UPI000EAA0141|nr:metallophosphoesterase [Butyrivibrio sp. X503]RKM54098.1 bifunctional metallophosphatase/5'-nucleotidase [Butyrivibrio sp. X503]